MKFKNFLMQLLLIILIILIILDSHSSQGFPLDKSNLSNHNSFLQVSFPQHSLISVMLESQPFAEIEHAADFDKKFNNLLETIHQQIDEVNQTITSMEDEEIRTLLKLALEEGEKLDDISVSTLSDLSTMEEEDEIRHDEDLRQISILEEEVEALKTFVTMNRSFLNKQMRVSKQKYSKKRILIKDIIADFMGLIAAGKKLPDPFSASGAAQDLADVLLRMPLKLIDLGKDIQATIEDLKN